MVQAVCSTRRSMPSMDIRIRQMFARPVLFARPVVVYCCFTPLDTLRTGISLSIAARRRYRFPRRSGVRRNWSLQVAFSRSASEPMLAR